MYVKFKNGVEKVCSNPTEQKIFKGGVAAGWICAVVISDTASTSAEIDDLLTIDNISQLTFLNDESAELFTINGYSKVTSAVIRHSENNGTIEIQLQKEI